MRIPLIIAASVVALSAASPAAAQPAEAWQIGPIIGSRNFSVGMPLSPSPARRGWYFDFPYPTARAGHVHYVSFNHGPLTGKRRIVMRYRIDAAPGVRFVPQERPNEPATISLVFQQRGDNWTGRGRYGSYRWYSPGATVQPITPGEHVMVANLDPGWTNVNGGAVAADPRGFANALEDTQRVGIVFGSSGLRGHGVFATGPARVTVLSFQVM